MFNKHIFLQILIYLLSKSIGIIQKIVVAYFITTDGFRTYSCSVARVAIRQKAPAPRHRSSWKCRCSQFLKSFLYAVIADVVLVFCIAFPK